MAKKKVKKIGNDELEEQFKEKEENFLLPVAERIPPQDTGKVRVFANWDTEAGKRAYTRYRKLRFPQSALLVNLAIGVTRGDFPTRGTINGGSLNVNMTPEILEKCWEDYKAFRMTLPVSKWEILGINPRKPQAGTKFQRITMFVLAVERNTGADLSDARKKLGRVNEYVKENILRPEELNWAVPVQLLHEAEQAAAEASRGHLLSEIRQAGATAGYSAERVEKAITEAQDPSGFERGLRDLLFNLRSAANDVTAIQHSRERKSATGGRPRHQQSQRPQRFQKRWQRF